VFFSKCANINTNSEKEIYHIIKPKIKKVSDSLFYPPPTLYYRSHNFILIDSVTIYYHKKYVIYHCGTGIDFSKPPFLNLLKNDLIEIKQNQLYKFLVKNNIGKAPNGFDKTAVISSPKDTIDYLSFKIITDYYKTNKLERISIRRWTEEEMYVSNAKKNETDYNPNIINWKTGFDH
jgi:hypothetical protein